jgi:hypothetical protein
MPTEWSEEKNNRLRRMWDDLTMSVQDMAEALGVSPLAISQQRKRLGLPSRYPNRAKAPERAE